jgi:hypothetical protein
MAQHRDTRSRAGVERTVLAYAKGVQIHALRETAGMARREWKMLCRVDVNAAICGAYDRADVLPRTTALKRPGGYSSTASS